MMTKPTLRHRLRRSGLSVVVAAAMIGSISYFGVTTYKDSHAATGASLYVTPDTTSVASGANISVTIREDSGADAINSVQASLNYDASKLKFVSITEGSSFPFVAATSTNTAGIVRISRAVNDGSVTGDHPVVTVNFKATAASGTATVGFEKGFSFLTRSSDSKDILQNVGSGSYQINAVAAAAAATTRPTMYLNPATGSISAGSTLNVAVRLDAHDTAVSTVEAAIGYPADQLEYSGITEGGVYTTKQRTNPNGGVVDIIRAVPGGSAAVTGDKTVVTLSFKVIGSSGAASLTITPASAAFDTSSTGINVLDAAGSAGATYTIGGNGSAVVAPNTSNGNAAADTAVKSVTSPSQALTAEYTGATGSVAISSDEKGNALTTLGGLVSLSPVIDPAILAANPSDKITKVDYYIDTKLASSQTTSPYTYKLDTNKFRNGTYDMVIKTTYASGITDTRSERLLIDNKVTLAYVTRHYLASIAGTIGVLLALLIIVAKLVIPRFSDRRVAMSAAHTDHDIKYGFDALRHLATPTAPVAVDPTIIAPQGVGTADTSNSEADSVFMIAATPAQTTQALPFTAAPDQPSAVDTPAPSAVIMPDAIPAVTPTSTAAVSPTVAPAMPVLPTSPAPRQFLQSASPQPPSQTVSSDRTPQQPPSRL